MPVDVWMRDGYVQHNTDLLITFPQQAAIDQLYLNYPWTVEKTSRKN